jgi:glycosyltransferase involved in cell wall biosynthesis
MRIIVFAGRMPDLCGAFLHDVELSHELIKRGHEVIFMTIETPKEGVNGGHYRGIRYLHWTAGDKYLLLSEVWICPHAPALPEVRKINKRYNRPIAATCHYDGNYTAIVLNNPGRRQAWVEFLMFINRTMEPNYRKNISPWPPNVVKTAVVRPIMFEDRIRIDEEFTGEYITLVNANQNKGVKQFIDMATAMPERKFLGVIPYYGELKLPDAPDNIKWVPFDDDIRTILKETHILVMPSYYESFGRIAFESMYNGIPVLYSKPNPKSKYPGGSTEGVEEWISPAGISCDRDKIEEWKAAIESLDDAETYASRSDQVRAHVRSMNIFTEGSRIAYLVEQFARENPVPVPKTPAQEAEATPQRQAQAAASIPRPPESGAGLGLLNGRLRIRR